MIREKILQWALPYVRVPLVGIDFSDRTFKCLKIRDEGGVFDIDFFGEVSLPEGVIVHGEIQKEDELSRIMRSWLEKDGKSARSSFVVASLPEEKSFLRVLQLPKMNVDAIGQAVRWEIEANVPIPADQLVYDYEIISPIEDSLSHSDVVIIAFPKAIIESYARALKRAGFFPYALELESQAIMRAVVSDFRARSVKIIVDLGRERTSLIVFSGGAIIFTTTVAVGGRIFEEHIARTLGVSFTKALSIKKEYGLDPSALDGKLAQALAPALSLLQGELLQAVQFYQTHAGHAHGAEEVVSEIVLTGGDANLRGLGTYIASALKIPVRTADVLKNFCKGDSCFSLPKNQALAFTTAVGLALRGIRTE